MFVDYRIEAMAERGPRMALHPIFKASGGDLRGYLRRAFPGDASVPWNLARVSRTQFG